MGRQIGALLTSTEAVPKAKILIQCKPSNLLNNVKMVGLSYLVCNLSFSICIKFLHWTEESPAPTKGDKRRPKTQNCETCTISVDFSWEIDKTLSQIDCSSQQQFSSYKINIQCSVIGKYQITEDQWM
jgi:hypothetical protein